MTSTLNMEQCPKFHHCNAPLCPLDPEWNRRTMIQGENLCHYLCEASKNGAIERFANRYDKHILTEAFNQADQMRRYSKALERGLARAASAPSVIEMTQLEMDF